ncbi:hypothetical protein DV736_g3077, partial [Chaetothyriales sp. CBS 134916]
MSYSGPFTDEMHGEGVHDAISPVTMVPSPTIKQHAISEHGSTSSHHRQQHMHLDLSKRLHFLDFGGFNSAKAAHVTHPHHFSYPTWPHFLAHSSPFHMTQLTSWAPPADVRQTPDCYLIEIEVPGLSKGDEEKILVQWMSPRTVIVSAEIRRSALPSLVKIPPADSKASDDIVDVSKSDVEDGGRLQRTEKHSSETVTETKETETTDQSQDAIFLARERHAGYWRRSFTLPEDTDFSLDPNVSGSGSCPGYALEAGVLSIEIPRKKADKK